MQVHQFMTKRTMMVCLLAMFAFAVPSTALAGNNSGNQPNGSGGNPPSGPGNVCQPGYHGEPAGSNHCVHNGNGAGNCDQNQSDNTGSGAGNGGNDYGNGHKPGCSDHGGKPPCKEDCNPQSKPCPKPTPPPTCPCPTPQPGQQGPTGPQGPQGAPGQPGANGTTTVVTETTVRPIGTPRLHGPGGCIYTKRTFRVTGGYIASVTFLLNGKVVKVDKSGPFTYTLNAKAHKAGTYKLTAQVTLLPSAKAGGTLSLVKTVRVCKHVKHKAPQKRQPTAYTASA
jgi:hypothetical protein